MLACRRVPDNAVLYVGFLVGDDRRGPDLWGFCGGMNTQVEESVPTSPPQSGDHAGTAC